MAVAAAYPGHSFGTIPMFNDTDLLAELKKLVTLEPAGDVKRPSGVPPHVKLSKELRKALDDLQIINKKVDSMEGKIISAVKGAVKDSIDEVAAESGQVTAPRVMELLETKFASFAGSFSKQIDDTIRAAMPAGAFDATGGVPEAVEEVVGSGGSNRLYDHSGSLGWMTPKGFQFPSPSLQNGWALWVFGLPGNKSTDSAGRVVDAPIRPFRKLAPKFVPANIRRILMNWRSIYSLMDAGEVAENIDGVSADAVRSTFLSETFKAGLANVQNIASYAFQQPKWRTWTVCYWASKITRSAIMKDGLEADKAKLPQATIRNKLKPEGSKRKRKKGSAVKNTSRNIFARISESSTGISGASSSRSGATSTGAAGAAGTTGTTGATGRRNRGGGGASGRRPADSSGGSSSSRTSSDAPILLEFNPETKRFADADCECCNSGLSTRHRCQVEDPNGKYMYRNNGPNVPPTLICGKAFCVLCMERWGSESRTNCERCLGLEIDARTKAQAAAALTNAREERRNQRKFTNDDADALFDSMDM